MLIFAHRGASAHAPENTLEAVELALKQQADGIELDVHQHVDEFVVIHDQWLHRTTNGQGRLNELSFTELRALDAGNRQMIPTLREVMALISGQCILNIEVKGVENIQLLLDYTSDCAAEFGFSSDQILFSSFDHPVLANLKRLSPTSNIGALTASKPLNYAQFAQEMEAYSVNADVGFLDQKFVEDAKRRGLKVFVYTVDERADLLKLQKWGIDGVFVNSPECARQFLNN